METHEMIKLLRESQGLSQETLAERVGYKDRSSVAKIEAGLVDLSQSKIAAFADALGVSPARLMGIGEKNPPALVDERIWETICADSAKLKLVTWIAGLDQSTFQRMEKILDAAFAQ